MIYSPASQPLERFVFDLSSFPTIHPSDANIPFDEDSDSNTALADLAEQFRGAMQKLALCGSSLTPLPAGCSFTVCIELKADGEAPVSHSSTPWIPSQPSLQPAATVVAEVGGAKGGDHGTANESRDRSKRNIGSDLGGVRTTPIRTIEAGAFMLEVWVEEGKAKANISSVASSG